MPPSRIGLPAKDNNAASGEPSADIAPTFSFSGRAPGARPGRGGLLDSVDAVPMRQRSSVTASSPLPPSSLQGNPEALNPEGHGRGGIAGMRDPYDRPTRSQLLGAQSRLRQDKSTGALKDVAGRYRVLFGGHHVVRKGLRRSIADAYAAYVGQVVNLPEDTYGLALRALDHTFNTPSSRPPGAIDLNLHTSPYVTSPAKHAQVFNTAHRIMRDLGGYVYDVSYYCPGELDQLRDMRRGEASSRREGYRSAPRLQPGEPPQQREAVAVGRRVVRRTPGELAGDPAVNPITGALRPAGFDPGSSVQVPRPQQQQQPHWRPRTAPPGAALPPESAPASARQGAAPRTADPRSTAAAAARSVSAALGEAAAADARERVGGGGPEQADEMDELEQRQRRDLRRLSSPGMFTKTPTHYRVSKYYDHVTPTEDVLQMLVRKKALREAQRQMTSGPALALDPRGAAGPGSIGGDDGGGGGGGGGAAGSEGAGGAEEEEEEEKEEDPTMAVMKQVLAVGTRPEDGYGGAGARLGGGSRSRPAPRHPSPHDHRHSPHQPGGDPTPDAVPPYGQNETERILWIIETAYELGLAEVLGLEGPPPDNRSRRLSPLPYRRQFYDGVYSSPERYVPYAPYTNGQRGRQWEPGYTSPPGRPGASPPPPHRGLPPRTDGYLGYVPYGYQYDRYGYQYDGATARHLQEAAARRYVRQVGSEYDEVKIYGRSRRVFPGAG